MKSNNSPERFPILTIFSLIFLAWQAGIGVIYLWVVGEPTTPAIAVSLARLFVLAGLPFNSLVPLMVEGRTFSAGQWLQAASTPAGATTLRASNWLIFYVPAASIFLTVLSILLTKKWAKRKGPKLVRGVSVVKR